VRAELGHGTERHHVGFYSHQTNDVGVARYDWTDEATFGYFADAYLQDTVCLTGSPDESVHLSVGTAKSWKVRNQDGSASAGTMLVITMNGTVLNVSCDWGDLAECRDFAPGLLDALDVS
jgi:hypothetical protein